MRIAVVAAIAGAAVFVIRRFLGSRDADWQAARPTTPYAPPRPAETSQSAESAATAAAPTVDGADAGDDPQGGLSAHLVNLEADGAAVPDQPAEGGDVEAPAEAITEIEESLFETSVGEETPTEAAPEPEIAEPVTADDEPRPRSRRIQTLSPPTRLPRQSLPPWRARGTRVRVSTSDTSHPRASRSRGTSGR